MLYHMNFFGELCAMVFMTAFIEHQLENERGKHVINTRYSLAEEGKHSKEFQFVDFVSLKT